MKRKIIYIFIIFILSIAINFFIENFRVIGNTNNINNKIEITKKMKDNVVKNVDNPSDPDNKNAEYQKYQKKLEINISKINSYVKNIRFKYSGIKDISIIQVYDNSIKDEKLIINDKVSPSYNKKSISINKNVKSLKLVLLLKEDSEFNIENIKIHNNITFNILRFSTIFLILILVTYVYLIFIKKAEVSIGKLFLILATICGLMYVFFTPIFFSWDEKEHFVKSYNLAQGNFIMKKGEKIKWPSNTDDFFEKNAIGNQAFSSYDDYSLVLKENNKKSNEVYKYYHSTAITYTFVPYIFSSIGIFLGKLFKLSLLTQFYLGRAFNVIFYVLISLLSIKLVKTKKMQLLFATVLLFPTIIFQSASYSADVMTNACSILSIAIIINLLRSKEKIQLKKIFALLIACSLTTLSKVAYFPIFFLILLLDKNKFNSKKEKIIYSIAFIIVGIVLFCLETVYASKLGLSQWANPGVDSKKQLLFIIDHPFKFIEILFKTMEIDLFGRIQGFSTVLAYCGQLGNFYTVLLIIIISILATDIDEVQFSHKQRIMLLLIVLSMLFASLGSLYMMFTVVGASVVSGFQGRYLVPIIIPFLLLFSNTINIKKYKLFCNVMLILVILINVISLLYILGKFYL